MVRLELTLSETELVALKKNGEKTLGPKIGKLLGSYLSDHLSGLREV